MALALEALEAKLLEQRFGVGAKPRRARKTQKAQNSVGAERSRNVPFEIRRGAVERDGMRCAYVDPETGLRCTETRGLELQHDRAFAKGGEHSLANVGFHCRPHNAEAARRDLGAAHIDAAIAASRARREQLSLFGESGERPRTSWPGQPEARSRQRAMNGLGSTPPAVVHGGGAKRARHVSHRAEAKPGSSADLLREECPPGER